MASVIDRRLFEQANNLCEAEHPVIAVVTENIWKDFYFSRSRWVHKQYLGTIATLTAKYPKLQIIHLDSDDMFIDFLALLHKKLTEDGNKERPSPVMRRAKSLEMRKENMLCAVDGVSVATAKKLLKKYKTIENLCTAEVKDLILIEKIGQKQAEKIYKILHD